ncbi:MAG: DUF3810 domain-containing protein [Flavobacteriaceae bacterium]|jgi:hypothetical protein|nr:DUF3810 domain-containing protein [Flavobacteriaceae bacterium]
MKKINLNYKNLISALILQFFFFQIIGMSKSFIALYAPFTLKIKQYINSFFGMFPFSVGDVFYLILSILLLYLIIRIIIFLIKKKRSLARPFVEKILLIINILYFLFMFSFGLLYHSVQFSNYAQREKISTPDFKAVANYLLKECIALREKVSVDKSGNFAVKQEPMIRRLYQEQSVFYDAPLQKNNLKTSLFSPIMKKLGVQGYYNPFTNEAQVVSGLTPTALPFTLAHEMGHQQGVAPENEASFYSFLMGETSPNTDYQYSVKYRALFHVLRNIYPKDSVFTKNILNNFSSDMKKDYERDKKYSEEVSGAGSQLFSLANNAFLKANRQDGIIAYDYLAGMVVTFYKKNYPSIFEKQ